MFAVDTKVVVRFLVNDDPRQSPLARDLFLTRKLYIAKTVLLETAWVLRKAYGLEEAAIRFGLTSLIALPSVEVEDEAVVRDALILADHGIDFADALRLSSRPPGAGFATFDKPLFRKAKRAGLAGIAAL